MVPRWLSLCRRAPEAASPGPNASASKTSRSRSEVAFVPSNWFGPCAPHGGARQPARYIALDAECLVGALLIDDLRRQQIAAGPYVDHRADRQRLHLVAEGDRGEVTDVQRPPGVSGGVRVEAEVHGVEGDGNVDGGGSPLDESKEITTQPRFVRRIAAFPA